tara:strand:- start:2786 stop:3097 length:312 start_codon:yes stop_codon:yes gene_type:complete
MYYLKIKHGYDSVILRVEERNDGDFAKALTSGDIKLSKVTTNFPPYELFKNRQDSYIDHPEERIEAVEIAVLPSIPMREWSAKLRKDIANFEKEMSDDKSSAS